MASLKQKNLAAVMAALIAITFPGCTETKLPQSNASSEISSTQSSGSSEQSTEPPAQSTASSQNEPVITVITPEEIEAFKAFDRLAQQAADNHSAMGMSIALFKNGQVIHTFNTGFAVENEIPCANDTVYRVASVSKLVSAASMMTLFDKGKITPYSRLTELTGIPFDREGGSPILLWHLMTHTAGLNDNALYNSAVEFKYDTPGCKYYPLTEVLGSGGSITPGAQYSYTNFGMGTIGAVIEKISGEYFAEYTDSALFRPMGLNAGYCVDQIYDRNKIANIYQAGSLSYIPKNSKCNRAFYREFDLGESYLSAATELLISAPDLAKIGIVLSGDGTLNGKRILSKEAVDLMNKTFFSVPGEHEMGLSVRKYKDAVVSGRTICGHPGQALGNVNGLYYDPSDGTGIAICTSGCSAEMNKNGVYEILNDCITAAYDNVFTTNPNP